MRPQHFSLLIPLLFVCSILFADTTDSKDSPGHTIEDAYRDVIGEQLLLLNEYRAVNYDLTLKLQECNGYKSVGMPNAENLTLNPSPGGEGLARAASWRSTGDFHLAQYNEKAGNAAEVIDSLNNVIQQITSTVPEKGSGADAWYGWIAAGAMLIYNFVTWIIKNKKKKS